MSLFTRVWSRAARLPWGSVVMLPMAGLLWQSFFWLDRVPVATKIACAGFGVLSALRPAAGLLVLAAFATLGSPFADFVGAPYTRTAETLMLTFLVGWLARSLVRREPILDQDSGLAAPIALFALTIAASLVVTSTAVQSATAPPWEYLQSALALLSHDYLGWAHYETHNWYSAAPLVEGGLLCAAVLRLTRRRPELQAAMARMLAIGVVAAALFSLVRVSAGLVRADHPAEFLFRIVTSIRISAHTADLNAAGSHFVLVLPLLWTLGLMAGRWRSAWILGAVAVVAALWLTGSRAAQFSILLMLAGTMAVKAGRLSVSRLFLMAVALALTIGVIVASRPGPESSIVATLNNRWLFSRLSWDMFATSPLFGVGISEYYIRSAALMPDALRALYVAENAHNNFAQIGVELGVVGLGIFIWLLAAAWRRIRQGLLAVSDPLLRGLCLGLASALLTFTVGHPLLVGAFACSFWIALALAVVRADTVICQSAGETRSSTGLPAGEIPARRMSWTVATVALAIVVSVPFRAHLAREDVDLSNVRFGFEPGGVDAVTKDQFRWAGPRATIFVSTLAQSLSLSVSPETETDPVELELRIDGRLANRIVLREGIWRDLRLIMPARGSKHPFWRIDLIVHQLSSQSGTKEPQSDSDEPRIRVRTITEQ